MMAEFGLIKSFDIDDGQLDGLTPQHIFVLGYELATIDWLLQQPAEITRNVHAANRERIEKSCKDSGRRFKLSWISFDIGESWMLLDVNGTAN